MGIKLNKVHHIGYAVPSIVKAESLFQVLGYERLDSRDVKDPMQNIRAVFLRHLYTEGYIIELLEPLDAQKPSTVDFIINKRKTGSLHAMPYHICYEVDNLMAAIAELRKENHFYVSSGFRDGGIVRENTIRREIIVREKEKL